MKKSMSNDTKTLIAAGVLIVALSLCSVYTAVKTGAEEPLEKIQEFTLSEAESYQRTQEILLSINQRLETIGDEITESNKELQTTLEETMDQLTAMNAVFLEYGQRMGILVQEE